LKEKIEKSKKVISQYKKVFGSPEGKAVLYDLMKSNFLIHSSVMAERDSETFANIGRQDLVKKIIQLLRIDPETFLQQMEEQEGSHV
jgi:hypothetical protein